MTDHLNNKLNNKTKLQVFVYLVYFIDDLILIYKCRKEEEEDDDESNTSNQNIN